MFAALLSATLSLELPGLGQSCSRRALCAALPAAALTSQWPGTALADEAELREKAAALRAQLAELEALQAAQTSPPPPVAAADVAPPVSEPAVDSSVVASAPSAPSAFDFDVLFRGEPRDIDPFVGKRASVVVNVKFTDPISLEQMPALASLADKYKNDGLSVLAFPTEQGWFEENDSNTLRLQFKQTYEFGRYPTSVVFDKADLLGTNALPLYSYLTGALANPWGVNRIVFNYEKFLLDADGRPLRRYPRKFPANLMESDVQAVLAGKPLPPPSARLVEAWEAAKRESIKSEYAFKPGLNYYQWGSPAS